MTDLPPLSKTQPKERNHSMTTSVTHDISDIHAALTDAIEQLTAAVNHHRAAIDAAKDTAEDIHKATGALLENIRRNTKGTHSKPAKKRSPKASLAEKPGTKIRKGSEEIAIAGKKIILPGEAARIMRIMIEKSGDLCTDEQLGNGTASALPSHLTIIRKALKETFGDRGLTALITHRGQGHSFDLQALH